MDRERYNIIYADPPWTYRDKAVAGERGVEFKYSTMIPQEIGQLPIQSITAEDCALFLWSTMPQLPVALEVMKAWNFEYKTVAFTWIKRTKHNKLACGMGSWSRANPEIVLLGTRGRPKRLSASVHSVVEAPLREHSRKPDEVRERIVTLLGDIPRCELFARPPKPDGWDVWGDEIESTFTL
jgi:site-specific DNA-methyltransferase (adenine-specific)